MSNTLHEFINGIPKAELHLHIEGSFEPELMFRIAQRNKIAIPFNSVEEVKQAYNFSNLQDFLNIYYAGANVLITEQDFYDLTMAYLTKAHEQNVAHCEIFFDPQTHTQRGVAFHTVITGITNALSEARDEWGLTGKLIMCFLRDLSAESAMQTLQEASTYKYLITGVGLDSAEVGNPPTKFEEVFRAARDMGFELVAHAGEEGPSEYVWEALDQLNVSRIDHGNRALEDDDLVNSLARTRIPLTVCPLSNLKLQVVTDMTKHPLKTMMERGLLATVNSDDPAYFGGYINENFYAVTDSLKLTKDDIVQLAKNSFSASYLSNEEKEAYIAKVEAFAAAH